MEVPLLALAALVLVAVTLLYVLLGGSGKAPPAVLLLGPCGGGKTLLFHRLTEGAVVESVTSMAASEGRVALAGGGGRAVVDFPGHPRLRQSLAAALERSVGVVFCFDASDAAATAKAAAELLYAVLTAEKCGAPILVLCTKADSGAPVKSPARARLMLSNELETLRKTASANASLGEAGPAKALLGKPGQFFSFESHAPCDVSFEAFSGKTGDLDAVRAFIAGCE